MATVLLEAEMRFSESWLAHALLGLWIAAVVLLHYGLLADTVLGSLLQQP
ncbi:MAG: hypothetical protein JSV65_03755 [Armatimonadota bacterium]|nr:MAG: hypothetical protein JSV65_03755 [Armatimonadota bacterium]